MNSKILTLFLIFLGVFISALFSQMGELLWLAFPFLMYVTIGLIKFPALDTIHLQAQRLLCRTSSDGQPVVEVEVTIRNQGGTLPCLQMIDSQLDGMIIITGQTGMMTSVFKGGEASLKYSFVEKRGRYTWKSAHVRISDPLGIMSTDLTLPAAAEISIQPERDNFKRLPLRPHHTLHAPGSIPARQAGSGTDFWGVRLYHPGDSLRWLYWRMNARHPGQFFTREFEREEVADIGLILDARSETDQIVGEDSLFEYSVSAAASLAEGFIGQGNRVSLLVLGKTIIRVFPGYGKHQLNRILKCLSRVKSSSSGKVIGLHYLPLEMFSNRALLVVLSPLSRSDSLFFPRLRAARYQAMLISPDPYDFIYPTLSKDPYSQRAFFLTCQERRIQLQSISRLNIRVIDWQVGQPLYSLIRSSLGHIRGHGENGESYGA
jgi:uncharacterized protein (DUF58 family)